MEKIKAIVADDEEQLRIFLIKQLSHVWPELVICGEAGNGTDALALIKDQHPDMAFLDIKMPGLSGIEVAREVAGDCLVVFITAFDEYAVEAFENEAVDYIVKPISYGRLHMTVERLKKQISATVERKKKSDIIEIVDRIMIQMQKKNKLDYLQWLRVQQGNDIVIISTDEVSYFKSSDKYTIVMANGKEAIIRKPIKELAEELDPNKFWQIHRGVIVNVSSIDKVSSSRSGKFIVRMKGMEETLTVSRTYTYLFKQ